MIKKIRFRVQSILISDYNIDLEKFMDELTEKEIKVMNLIIDHTILQTREYFLDHIRYSKYKKVIKKLLK